MKPRTRANFWPLNLLRMQAAQRKQLAKLKRILSPGELRFEPGILKDHSGDKWFAEHQPDAVAFPRRVESVAAVMRYANQHGVPVTARGAGQGYVGGCVPA